MFDLRLFLACSAARLARAVLHLIGRGGTAVPGKIALTLCPDLLHRLGKGVDVLLVTGTNGKSTAVGMLRHMLSAQGIDHISNRSGANIVSGIASDLIFASSPAGKPRAGVSVLECDEGHLAAVAGALQPKSIVVTNLFDDQVDRLGGAMRTRALIAEGIARAPDAVLCLNADDSVSGSLAEPGSRRAVYFGMGETAAGEGGGSFPCPRCGGALRYSRRVYAHLGRWSCPACGLAAPEAEWLAERCESDPGGSTVWVAHPAGGFSFRLALPAVYNVYNALAALAGAQSMGWDARTCAGSLADFSAVFGRMETLRVGGSRVQMILVKNAAGFDRALDAARRMPGSYLPVFCLNNHTGDGVDISWINDVDFEDFFRSRDFAAVGLYGSCAAALKARLLRAGVAEEKMKLFESADALARAIRETGGDVMVFPNYTAMLAVREKLASLAGEKKFWE